MKIAHHPDDSTLMSYAAGSLPAALAAVTAAHLDLCPRCRREVRLHEAIGGAFLDRIEPADLTRPAPALAAGANEAALLEARPRQMPPEGGALPASLQIFVGPTLSDIPFQPTARGIAQHRAILAGPSRPSLLFLKVDGGGAIPDHGHGGSELTLVLSGGYRDALGHFATGDLADLDVNHTHEPIADAEGCICVVASDLPPRFTSPLMRLWSHVRG